MNTFSDYLIQSMLTRHDEIQFCEEYTKLNNSLITKLTLAQTSQEAQEALEMVEGLARCENSPAAAKTMYGLAYLMDDKPWYDFKRGFEAVKEAAESDEPFCWFILGSLYLNGKRELPKDLVSAKYWIEKAAEAGNKDAIIIRDFEWGEHPEGFKEYVKTGELENDMRLMFYIKMGLIGLGIIGVVFYLLFGLRVL